MSHFAAADRKHMEAHMPGEVVSARQYVCRRCISQLGMTGGICNRILFPVFPIERKGLLCHQAHYT